MQKSIEWLQQKYDNCPESFLTDEDFEKAKEMHKREIIDAFWNGSSHWDSELEAEQYYNESFKKDAKDVLYQDISHRGYPRSDVSNRLLAVVLSEYEKELIYQNERNKYEGSSWEVELDYHKETFMSGIDALIEYLNNR